jgi:hypothetical protein
MCSPLELTFLPLPLTENKVYTHFYNYSTLPLQIPEPPHGMLWFFMRIYFQFIFEQSVLTSLAASGVPVTMESRHHTLHPPPLPEKIFWLKATPSIPTTPLCQAVAEGCSAYIYKLAPDWFYVISGCWKWADPGVEGCSPRPSWPTQLAPLMKCFLFKALLCIIKGQYSTSYIFVSDVGYRQLYSGKKLQKNTQRGAL